MVTSFKESNKQVIYYLLNDSLASMGQLAFEKQSSQVHIIKPIEIKEAKLFFICQLYSVSLLAIIYDKLIPLTSNGSVCENMLNGVDYDDFTKTLFISDTRRLIKVFKIE